MKRRIVLVYQLLIGLSDGVTGLLLILAPAFTLRLMHLEAPAVALPYLSFIGAFVLSVGLARLYGGFLLRNTRATDTPTAAEPSEFLHQLTPRSAACALAARSNGVAKLEVVWLLTGITRGIVAVFIASQIVSGTLETGWTTVAVSDGAFALIQGIGLFKGWLPDACA